MNRGGTQRVGQMVAFRRPEDRDRGERPCHQPGKRNLVRRRVKLGRKLPRASVTPAAGRVVERMTRQHHV